jgi:hypothetical protein
MRGHEMMERNITATNKKKGETIERQRERERERGAHERIKKGKKNRKE